ncbi:uncharacterized protein LOC122375928 isoform X2 [Amphibalanus amphitrite]|uniref:uncharacterized protein LOC122375928 isoform X2 n=1 Tax=Amphibalanus amphitrite TaxID=1232801 RepID=UPI001C90F317|nr:uncharacterized protein LOC122375928 isoform X2 [Amphibalanus amphitrite]
MRWVQLCAIFASLIIGCSHWFPRTPEVKFYRLHRDLLKVTRASRCRTDVLRCGKQFPDRASCRLVVYREAGTAWLMPAGQSGRLRYCRCHPAWSGSRCQRAANPCQASPCAAGRRCVRSTTSATGYSCLCAGGDGNCSPVAARSPRLAGGTCRGRPCGVGWHCKEDPTQPAGYSCGCDRKPGYQPASETDPTCVRADLCTAHRPCRHGGTCLSLTGDYRCQCAPAWTGRSCEAPLNPCHDAELCTAGWTCRREPRSRAGYSCGCEEKPGWAPRSEDDPQCVLRDTCLARSPCLNGGTCESGPKDGFTCRCPPAWHGDTCEKPRDPCRTGNPCGETWKCHRDPDSPAGFSCNCGSRPGWAAKSEEDPRCAVSDPCLTGSPCLNGGSCQYLSPGEFNCQCRSAWTGRTCDVPRDPCGESDTCGAGWKCRRDPSAALGYTCGCDHRPGWRATSATDPRCVLVEPCRAKAPCGNGGTCVPTMEDGEPGFRCQCPLAWGGPVCAEPRNPCAAGDARCGAGWSCRRDETSKVGYSCGCETRRGWRPRSLDDPSCVRSDFCRVRRPCRNGGRCGPGTTTEPFTCRCLGGWQGPLCQQPRDPCRLGSPCGAQDTCRRNATARTGYSCHCELRPGYRPHSGSDPRCVLDDACLAQAPCLHGGSCTPGRAGKQSFTCTCTAAWSGDRCELPRDPCVQEPETVTRVCGAKSGCSRDTSSEVGFACDCDARPGWRRRSSADPGCVIQDACLALKPCRHGGTCRNVADQADGFYRCFCPPAWTGRNCSEPLDPCLDPKNVCNDGFRCRRNPDRPLGFSCGCDEKPGYRPSSPTNPECAVYDTCLAQEPCANGGLCSPVGERNYFCECKKSWTGRTCEIVLVPCEGIQHTCGTRWRCHVDSKQPLGFTCGCGWKPGWVAAEDGHCVVADACLAYAPCANGGTCSAEGGTLYSCRCRAGWGGTTCEAPVDPCTEGEPCGSGFTCRRDTQSSTGFSCDCERRPGWRRQSEDDPRCALYDVCLADPPCAAGARCLSLSGGAFRCVCPPERRGTLCEQPVVTSAPPAPVPPLVPALLPEPSSSPSPEDEDEEEPMGVLREQPAFKPVPDTPVLVGFRRFLDELAVIAPKLKYVFMLVGLLILLILLFLVCFACCRKLYRSRRRDRECEYLLKKADMDRRCEQYLQAKYGYGAPCEPAYPAADPCEPYPAPEPCEPYGEEDQTYWDSTEPYPSRQYVPEPSSDESSVRGAVGGLRRMYGRLLGSRSARRGAPEPPNGRRSGSRSRSRHRSRRRRRRHRPSHDRVGSASSGVSSMSDGSESGVSDESTVSGGTERGLSGAAEHGKRQYSTTGGHGPPEHDGRGGSAAINAAPRYRRAPEAGGEQHSRGDPARPSAAGTGTAPPDLRPWPPHGRQTTAAAKVVSASSVRGGLRTSSSGLQLRPDGRPWQCPPARPTLESSQHWPRDKPWGLYRESSVRLPGKVLPQEAHPYHSQPRPDPGGQWQPRQSISLEMQPLQQQNGAQFGGPYQQKGIGLDTRPAQQAARRPPATYFGGDPSEGRALPQEPVRYADHGQRSGPSTVPQPPRQQHGAPPSWDGSEPPKARGWGATEPPDGTVLWRSPLASWEELQVDQKFRAPQTRPADGVQMLDSYPRNITEPRPAAVDWRSQNDGGQRRVSFADRSGPVTGGVSRPSAAGSTEVNGYRLGTEPSNRAAPIATEPTDSRWRMFDASASYGGIANDDITQPAVFDNKGNDVLRHSRAPRTSGDVQSFSPEDSSKAWEDRQNGVVGLQRGPSDGRWSYSPSATDQPRPSTDGQQQSFDRAPWEGAAPASWTGETENGDRWRTDPATAHKAAYMTTDGIEYEQWAENYNEWGVPQQQDSVTQHGAVQVGDMQYFEEGQLISDRPKQCSVTLTPGTALSSEGYTSANNQATDEFKTYTKASDTYVDMGAYQHPSKELEDELVDIENEQQKNARNSITSIVSKGSIRNDAPLSWDTGAGMGVAPADRGSQKAGTSETHPGQPTAEDVSLTCRDQPTANTLVTDGGQVTASATVIASTGKASVNAIDQLDQGNAFVIPRNQSTPTKPTVASEVKLTATTSATVGDLSSKPPIIPRRSSSVDWRSSAGRAVPPTASGSILPVPSVPDGPSREGAATDSAALRTSDGQRQNGTLPSHTELAAKGCSVTNEAAQRDERGRSAVRAAARPSRARSVPLPDPELQYIDDRYDF